MKVIILCGGRGIIDPESRERIPKGMIMVGNKPLLWHIMKLFSSFGHNEYILALGEGGGQIRDYFLRYKLHASDLEVDLQAGSVNPLHELRGENWNIKLVDTGVGASTGCRIARCRRFLEGAPFLATYSDCLANVNLDALTEVHTASGNWVTVSGVQPPSRFGTLYADGGRVTGYSLDTHMTGIGGFVNGGFMLMRPDVLNYVEPFNECNLEREIFEKLAAERKLGAYSHPGFWQAVDTERDIQILNRLYAENKRPWLPDFV